MVDYLNNILRSGANRFGRIDKTAQAGLVSEQETESVSTAAGAAETNEFVTMEDSASLLDSEFGVESSGDSSDWERRTAGMVSADSYLHQSSDFENSAGQNLSSTGASSGKPANATDSPGNPSRTPSGGASSTGESAPPTVDSARIQQAARHPRTPGSGTIHPRETVQSFGGSTAQRFPQEAGAGPDQQESSSEAPSPESSTPSSRVKTVGTPPSQSPASGSPSSADGARGSQPSSASAPSSSTSSSSISSSSTFSSGGGTFYSSGSSTSAPSSASGASGERSARSFSSGPSSIYPSAGETPGGHSSQASESGSSSSTSSSTSGVHEIHLSSISPSDATSSTTFSTTAADQSGASAHSLEPDWSGGHQDATDSDYTVRTESATGLTSRESARRGRRSTTEGNEGASTNASSQTSTSGSAINTQQPSSRLVTRYLTVTHSGQTERSSNTGPGVSGSPSSVSGGDKTKNAPSQGSAQSAPNTREYVISETSGEPASNPEGSSSRKSYSVSSETTTSAGFEWPRRQDFVLPKSIEPALILMKGTATPRSGTENDPRVSNSSIFSDSETERLIQSDQGLERIDVSLPERSGASHSLTQRQSSIETRSSASHVIERAGQRINSGAVPRSSVSAEPSTTAISGATGEAGSGRRILNVTASAKPSIAPRESDPASRRERAIQEGAGNRALSAGRERTSRLTVGRLNVQVVNVAEKPEESARRGSAKRTESDSVERRLMGRFDLV